MRVSFVKVVELQARAIPHIHALIRLDPPPADDETTRSGDHDRHGPAAPWGGGESRPVADQHTGWSSPITAAELAALIQRAARHVRIDVAAGDGDPDQGAVRTLRFGTQIDTQPLTPETTQAASDSETNDTAATLASRLSPRRVAAYLAKYVTKSLHDFGITARRLTAEAIRDLDVTEHVRAILATIAELAEHTASAGPSLAGIGRWLHTLGYRGHITTKSRRYSTTMGALRAARATWTRHQMAKHSGRQDDTQSAHSAHDVTASTGRRHATDRHRRDAVGVRPRRTHQRRGPRPGHLSSPAPHRRPHHRYHRIPDCRHSHPASTTRGRVMATTPADGAASNHDAGAVPLHERPEFIAWLTASCERQDLPVTITDPTVIERIATLLGTRTRQARSTGVRPATPALPGR